MLKILEIRALRGPNRYSKFQSIYMLLDIGEFEEKPTDVIPGFIDNLLALLPSLQEHRCSIGKPGGFIERLHRGTWIGHVVEHVSLELQCLAGIEVGFGKTYTTEQKGIYEIVCRYIDEAAGIYAAKQAVALVEEVIAGNAFDLDNTLKTLKDIYKQNQLGPSTEAIIAEAKQRDIPVIRLDENNFIQLGHGIKQRRIQATLTDDTSALGVEIADEKAITKQVLMKAGIPVPRGQLVTTLHGVINVANEIGFPVTIKPNVGNHGRGVTVKVENETELKLAFASAKKLNKQVMVEKHLQGNDYRALVIDGKFVAAALREPAHVIGDGKSTIKMLVNKVNEDPKRGDGHTHLLTTITIDNMTKRFLKFNNYKLSSIPPFGEKVYLKGTGNLSTGATACDITDQVHPEVKFMCERISRIVGLDCLGIDIIAQTLEQPLNSATDGIVEVNAAPGFRMHIEPTIGTGRNVAKQFVEMLFPADADFEMPIIAVTGTNGKTTTAKLIAHALKHTGKTVGFAGTTGVEIDGVSIFEGDYSGPEGAAVILREPCVDYAVFEVARGGIIRRGLGFENCNVGIVLNVAEDHLGLGGVNNLEELSQVKATVIESVRSNGTSVLNADDPIVRGLKERGAGGVTYFTMDPNNKAVLEHLHAGGTAVVCDGQTIFIRAGAVCIGDLPVADIPLTMNGAAVFNIENVMAAVAALHGLGLDINAIRNGIATFHPDVKQNPGRLNLIDFTTFKVLIDYGHNPAAIRALGNALHSLTAGRKIAVASGTGDRMDEHIMDFGQSLSDLYDYIIIADQEPRNRPLGETANLVMKGALQNGFDQNNMEIIIDTTEAIDKAFTLVQPGDLIVVQCDDFQAVLNRIMEHFEKRLQQVVV